VTLATPLCWRYLSFTEQRWPWLRPSAGGICLSLSRGDPGYTPLLAVSVFHWAEVALATPLCWRYLSFTEQRWPWLRPSAGGICLSLSRGDPGYAPLQAVIVFHWAEVVLATPLCWRYLSFTEQWWPWLLPCSGGISDDPGYAPVLAVSVCHCTELWRGGPAVIMTAVPANWASHCGSSRIADYRSPGHRSRT
jgi:hypothetical protein